MKRSIQHIQNAARAVGLKFYGAVLALAGLIVAGPVSAATGTGPSENLTSNNEAGQKTFGTVAANLDSASQTMAGLLIQFVSVGGFVVVAVSLYQLYKASKDEREKPMSAIVGLFIGGAMAAVGTIMWIMRNTVLGA
jgi:hypothetical protein